MVWLTWRQHRAQILSTVGLLALLGGFLLVNGLLAASAAEGLAPGSAELEAALIDRFRLAYQALGWLPVVPLAIGVFWGAPVVAGEYQRGTHRLAWTQSVPRRQWLATKLGMLGVLVLASATALGAMVSAWLGVFSGTRLGDRFGDTALFGGTGVAVGAWWLFAFMLGVTGGALFRRLLPAMAVMTALYLVVMFSVIVFGRDGYGTPEIIPVPEEGLGGGVIVVEYGWRDAAGRIVPEDSLVCEDAGNTAAECAEAKGYESVVRGHTADHYWRFQWTEAGLLLALTALLTTVTVHRVVRRPA